MSRSRVRRTEGTVVVPADTKVLTGRPAAVRYHNGGTVEEPLMGVRVKSSPEHFETVEADLKPLEYAARLAAHLRNGPRHEVVEPPRPNGNIITR